jgi:hypothetical protein
MLARKCHIGCTRHQAGSQARAKEFENESLFEAPILCELSEQNNTCEYSDLFC